MSETTILVGEIKRLKKLVAARDTLLRETADDLQTVYRMMSDYGTVPNHDLYLKQANKIRKVIGGGRR